MLGLDPDPAALWPVAVAAVERDEAAALRELGALGAAAVDASAAGVDPPAGERRVAALTAAAVALHCRAAIEAAGPACVAVKPQLACFERLGAAGWAALEAVTRDAHERGLLVVADGKRGDVPHTAHAYGQGLVGSTPGPFGPVRGLGADAFTANPLLGRDGLEPLVAAAVEAGAGCLVLVRTSNPGAAELQDAPAVDRPLHERVAGLVAELGAAAVGASGLSSVGAVVGATRPGLLARLRELMPRAVLLLPGVGAQGGGIGGLGAAFSPHPAAALVTASRAIVDAHRAGEGDPATAAASAAEELRAAAWSLAA